MEIEKQLLEAEDRRKAQELQDARELQISLLPQQISGFDNYEFHFKMEPATEVGGDYYDYSISDSNKLSLVIGDATNHGMKAGMMVSIMKSLFMSHIEQMTIKDFFNHCSKIIKQMNLRTLFMALMVVKIDGSSLKISSAGIPPLLIYRSKTKTIEEIKTKGMPLGALNFFPYQIASTKLNAGDTVLMMTDGLTELFNPKREEFGTKQIKSLFKQHVDGPVKHLVEALFNAGQSWAGNSNQNDDITIVAFKYQPES
jgi:serine phosphatase RsbU (regulator of sigma subunit)